MTSGNFDTSLSIGSASCADTRLMEFHINARIRKECDFDESLFASSGNVIFANVKAVRAFVQKYNRTVDGAAHPEHFLKAGQLNAMGLIDEIFHYVCRLYRQKQNASFFEGAEAAIDKAIGQKKNGTRYSSLSRPSFRLWPYTAARQMQKPGSPERATRESRTGS